MIDNRFSFGIAGGLGALAGADFLQHLIKATAPDHVRYAIVFEQQSFPGDRVPAAASYDPSGRKLHVFSLIRRLEIHGADAILLPCFISQTFLSELTPNIATPVVSLMTALETALAKDHPHAKRIGVLTSDFVRVRNLFGAAFSDRYEVVYPSASLQRDLMDAVYGEGGIKSGTYQTGLLGRISDICRHLAAQGCDIIVPGFTELSLVHDSMAAASPVPVLDANRCYADFALKRPGARADKAFKLGVVGGVGPLATVDFMGKVVKLTAADRDQDHIKMIVEQNPQIPDRTEHLVHDGTDPSIALFATCKKLEAAEADLIAIPCNTAHAFVDRMQGYLRVPVLNMLDETMAQAAGLYPGQRAGLLATSGTIASGVYAEAAARAGVEIIVPDAEHQTLVMEAIYGAAGVKAGFTEGRCREDVRRAIAHLAGEARASRCSVVRNCLCFFHKRPPSRREGRRSLCSIRLCFLPRLACVMPKPLWLPRGFDGRAAAATVVMRSIALARIRRGRAQAFKPFRFELRRCRWLSRLSESYRAIAGRDWIWISTILGVTKSLRS